MTRVNEFHRTRGCLRRIILFGLLGLELAAAGSASAQVTGGPTAAEIRDKVRAYRAAHEIEIVQEFSDLLAIPNLASDHVNIRRNAEHIVSMLRKRGVEAKVLEVPDAPPIVYGDLKTPGAKRTIIMYAHYDGQPVDPAQWTSPPWTPTLRDGPVEQGGKAISLANLNPPLNPEWRLYARAAGDDKTPIESVVRALDALHAANMPLSVNVKFFFEGEEEAGSAHLSDALQRYASLLQGDVLLLCDGPVHQTRKMQVFFGNRGEIGVEMTVYGPLRSLHDGHYGNWAPNPAAVLANLLASMRDADAHVLIPGFYDDVRPLTAAEKQAIEQMPDVDPQMRQELGLAWSEGDGEKLTVQITKPALNVRGIESGHVGEKAQNAIPTQARASVDFRLVPDQKPERVREQVEAFLGQQGFYVVHQDPDLETRRTHPRIVKLIWEASAYGRAARTSMDLPAARSVVTAIEGAIGRPVIKVPMLGGTLPMYLFMDRLKMPVMGVPIANHDNNQHAANENLRLQNLWDGIEVFAGILSGAGQGWE